MVDYDQDLSLPRRPAGKRGGWKKPLGSSLRGRETKIERAKGEDYFSRAKLAMARGRKPEAIALYNKALNTLALDLNQRQRATSDLRILGVE